MKSIRIKDSATRKPLTKSSHRNEPGIGENQLTPHRCLRRGRNLFPPNLGHEI